MEPGGVGYFFETNSYLAVKTGELGILGKIRCMMILGRLLSAVVSSVGVVFMKISGFLFWVRKNNLS